MKWVSYTACHCRGCEPVLTTLTQWKFEGPMGIVSSLLPNFILIYLIWIEMALPRKCSKHETD